MRPVLGKVIIQMGDALLLVESRMRLVLIVTIRHACVLSENYKEIVHHLQTSKSIAWKKNLSARTTQMSLHVSD